MFGSTLRHYAELFEHTYQDKWEMLSTFINCLDKILHQANLKGGIGPDDGLMHWALDSQEPLTP